MSTEVKDIHITQPAEPSSFRLIATLGVAGFLSGLALVSVFLLTKPIIEHNKAEAQRKAIFRVLPGTVSYKTLTLVNGKLTETNAPTGDVIFLGLNKNKDLTGFAINGKEPGFGDIIGVLYGYDPLQKTIIGYQVLECKETPGLGDKILKNEAFANNFKALIVEPEIVLVKNGAKKNANEVDAITGATISSRAVVKLLNQSVAKWKSPIESYMQENSLLPNSEKHE
jgi:electron transport complex protein RnfG